MLAALCAWWGLLCLPPSDFPAPVAPPALVSTKLVSAPLTETRLAPEGLAPSGFPKDCPRQPPGGAQAPLRRGRAPALRPERLRVGQAGMVRVGVPGRRGELHGDIGIAQFQPATAAELGVDPTDPRESISGMARYLVWTRARWTPGLGGRTDTDMRALRVATYNRGLGNMLKSQSAHGWTLYYPDAARVMPRVTRKYVVCAETGSYG